MHCGLCRGAIRRVPCWCRRHSRLSTEASPRAIWASCATARAPRCRPLAYASSMPRTCVRTPPGVARHGSREVSSRPPRVPTQAAQNAGHKGTGNGMSRQSTPDVPGGRVSLQGNSLLGPLPGGSASQPMPRAVGGAPLHAGSGLLPAIDGSLGGSRPGTATRFGRFTSEVGYRAMSGVSVDASGGRWVQQDDEVRPGRSTWAESAHAVLVVYSGYSEVEVRRRPRAFSQDCACDEAAACRPS
jgi:hypothetical protein